MGWMWDQCGMDVGWMWDGCGMDVGSMWDQCGINVEMKSMWDQLSPIFGAVVILFGKSRLHFCGLGRLSFLG